MIPICITKILLLKMKRLLNTRTFCFFIFIIIRSSKINFIFATYGQVQTWYFFDGVIEAPRLGLYHSRFGVKKQLIKDTKPNRTGGPRDVAFNGACSV